MGTVVCLTSGKGGAGKSTVAVGLANAFATRGKKTIVLELDIGLRSIDLFFGVSEAIMYDLGDVLTKRCSVNEALIAIPPFDCLHYLAAPAFVPDDFRFYQIEQLVEQLRIQYDIILIDTNAGLGLSIMACVRTADLAVVVTTPDVVCVRSGAKVTTLMEKYEFHNYRILINRVRAKMIRNTAIADLDDVMDMVGAPLLGILPEDDVYRKRSYQGRLPAPKSRIACIYDAVSRRIEGEQVPLVITKLFR